MVISPGYKFVLVVVHCNSQHGPDGDIKNFAKDFLHLPLAEVAVVVPAVVFWFWAVCRATLQDLCYCCTRNDDIYHPSGVATRSSCCCSNGAGEGNESPFPRYFFSLLISLWQSFSMAVVVVVVTIGLRLFLVSSISCPSNHFFHSVDSLEFA